MERDGSYESLETDFPGVEDLSSLPMERLRGAKISVSQAKTIKGRFMIFNESSGLHECELCDYRREWRGNLQVDLFKLSIWICLILFRRTCWPSTTTCTSTGAPSPPAASS